MSRAGCSSISWSSRSPSGDGTSSGHFHAQARFLVHSRRRQHQGPVPGLLPRQRQDQQVHHWLLLVSIDLFFFIALRTILGFFVALHIDVLVGIVCLVRSLIYFASSVPTSTMGSSGISTMSFESRGAGGPFLGELVAFGALGTFHQTPDVFLCRVGISLPPLLVLCTGNDSTIISRSSSLSGEAVLERGATGVWSTLVLEGGLLIEAGHGRTMVA